VLCCSSRLNAAPWLLWFRSARYNYKIVLDGSFLFGLCVSALPAPRALSVSQGVKAFTFQLALLCYGNNFSPNPNDDEDVKHAGTTDTGALDQISIRRVDSSEQQQCAWFVDDEQ